MMYVWGWFNSNCILFMFWILNDWHGFGWVFQNFFRRRGLETSFANNICNSASSWGFIKTTKYWDWQELVVNTTYKRSFSKWLELIPQQKETSSSELLQSFSHTQSFMANSYFISIESVLVILTEINNWPHYLYDHQCTYHSLQNSQ